MSNYTRLILPYGELDAYADRYWSWFPFSPSIERREDLYSLINWLNWQRTSTFYEEAAAETVFSSDSFGTFIKTP